MPALKRIHLKEVDSTNIYINKVEESNVIVTADYQTSGKGQGTNKWESEEGQNLLFSIKVSPNKLAVNRYFMLSMIGALALQEVLDKEVGNITLKWPNDIYWHDKKISGTLIETSIAGKFIQYCILGIGINVNQRVFLSDAPNPVSIWQIKGKETDREELLNSIIKTFSKYFDMLNNGEVDAIMRQYHFHLYRKEGFHWYEDSHGEFEAEISCVKENGHLVLCDKKGDYREYVFKEVKFIQHKE